MSCAILGCLAGAVLSGWLSDRLGRNGSFILQRRYLSVASFGTGSAGTFNIFIVYRVLGGIGIGLASNLSLCI
jgi:SP family sugar porter-like MFS transporter